MCKYIKKHWLLRSDWTEEKQAGFKRNLWAHRRYGEAYPFKDKVCEGDLQSTADTWICFDKEGKGPMKMPSFAPPNDCTGRATQAGKVIDVMPYTPSPSGTPKWFHEEKAHEKQSGESAGWWGSSYDRNSFSPSRSCQNWGNNSSSQRRRRNRSRSSHRHHGHRD
jgi:hypothetical protein